MQRFIPYFSNAEKDINFWEELGNVENEPVVLSSQVNYVISDGYSEVGDSKAQKIVGMIIWVRYMEDWIADLAVLKIKNYVYI